MYHGSNIEIDAIELEKCLPFKDFGKGFYTSPLKENALQMAKRTARINQKGTSCVTAFLFDDAFLTDAAFNVKQFSACDKEWAQFVINNIPRHSWRGMLISADVLARELSFRELSRQVSFPFHTEKAIAVLQKIEAYHE